MEPWQLTQRQSLPLAQKVRLSEKRIQQWYDHWHGEVYVAFSGGKDSTALLHLVRSLYPGVPAVFVDTGLEYPEIREFVKTTDNVTWLKPKMSFRAVIEKYGYPVVSKTVSRFVNDITNGVNNAKTRKLRLEGINSHGKVSKSMMLSKKWRFLIDAPFTCSDTCCDVLKKRPFHEYCRETGRKGINGTMASDSLPRRRQYYANGCNSFTQKKPLSKPLSVWYEDDIWAYLKENNVPYSKIYDMGETNTGCIFCMFGIMYDGEVNRFQRMKTSHPKLWNYCINVLKCGEVLDYINIPYGLHQDNRSC